jgi:hypothetical protein
MTIAPPTIVDLQFQGVAGAWVTCCNPLCLRATPIAFAAIGLAPETSFSDRLQGSALRLRRLRLQARGRVAGLART